jgi:hypothetical protein
MSAPPRRRNQIITRCAAITFAALLFAVPAAAQGDEDEGYRDSLVMDDNGDALVIWSPEGLDDVSLELRLRSPSGSETTLAADGQSVTTTQGAMDLLGFGSNPGFSNGVAAFKAGLETDGDGHSDIAAAVCTADTSAVTLIAEAHGGGNGTAVDPDNNAGTTNDFTICSIEPMPEINASGQVVFGTHVDLYGGATIDYNDCQNNSMGEWADENKAVIRYTSGGSPALECLMVGGDTLTLDPPFIGSSTTYTVTEVGFTHLGGGAFNSSGHAAAVAMLDNDVNVRADGGAAETPNYYYDDRTALVYLRDNGDFCLIAATGPDSIYQELMGAVINDSGQVLFKGEERSGSSYCGYDGYSCSETDASLNLFTCSGGITNIVDTDDQVPNSDYYYQGFSPHYSINSSGDVAFVAGMNDAAGVQNGNRNCGQGVYYWDGSTVTEIAGLRETWDDWNSDCTADTGGPFTTGFDGFDWQEFGSMASITDDGWVYFVAESWDDLTSGECAGFTPDDDGVTALLGWHPNQGMVEIMREGFEYDGELVNRIYAPQPELRDQTNGDQFAVTVVFDADRDCDSYDTDDYVEVIVPGVQPQEGPGIPALGKAGIALLIVLLAGIGVALSRRFV